MDIKPQDGFQTSFLTTEANITIGGGCAGAGKSYALLMEPLRHSQIKGFSATIFRRTTPQIRNSGGLWDTSYNLYSLLPDTKPRDISLQWVFEHIKVNFNHLEYEKNILDYQGAQLPLIMFDELTHFTEKMFFYMLSRNRSMCGVKPYIRATCNPDPESWVAEFISWWIDQDTGFPIPKRDGVLRYFTRDGQSIVWGDTKQEVIDKCPHIFAGLKEKGINLDDMVKSATFIHGDIYHNQKLIDKDPSYLANLLSQEDSIKSQLLEGNWKIKQDGLALCNYENIQNIFTNFAKKSTDRYISCDVARFGI